MSHLTLEQQAIQALTGSHLAIFEARICEDFQTGADPDGTTVGIAGGEVDIDGTAKIRTSGELTITGVDWPRGRDLLAAPYGNEIFLRRGVHLGHTKAWANLGYLRIDAPEQPAPPDGPLEVRLADRMATLIDSKLTAPRGYDTGTTIGEIVDDLVLDVYPDAVISWDDNSDEASIGRSTVVEEKRYETLKELADSLGKIVYWNGAGELVFETPPPAGDLAWDISALTDGGLTDMRRRLTRDGVYNGVVARGEGGDTIDPVQALVVDDNPNSPTRWGGRFGRVPRFFESSYLTTEQQCEDAAAGLLERGIGLPYSVDYGSVVNPWTRPFDRHRIEQADTNRDTHLIEKVTIPMTYDGNMSAATRDQTFAQVGG